MTRRIWILRTEVERLTLYPLIIAPSKLWDVCVKQFVQDFSFFWWRDSRVSSNRSNYPVDCFGFCVRLCALSLLQLCPLHSIEGNDNVTEATFHWKSNRKKIEIQSRGCMDALYSTKRWTRGIQFGKNQRICGFWTPIWNRRFELKNHFQDAFYSFQE